ncbi:hypothetical protein M896_040800 [Ordospora colligata OC4]|uniref:Uncharacterized protein n=1 Tax=Ordospora colligata OC4 TaxID=1354746 RepID=A0A0B2ULM6_9MICR|nr:uncharacterized protein M896_040800 [Ordospora colligata OC4]KHN69885.1 hypothetical protein M896_040800 [Ordospora colligata OC4]TBU16055.1 hypothetical protein CWI41_040800 [Ordospora colligata]
MSINHQAIERILNMPKDAKINQKEQLEIARMFVNGVPLTIPIHKVAELARMFVSCTKRMYLNEVKKYLQENNSELYAEYANMFCNNPGVFEAFGIKSEHRGVLVKNEAIQVTSLKPRIILSKKSRSTACKRKIRKGTQDAALRKLVNQRNASSQYKKKINKIYKEIKKE